MSSRWMDCRTIDPTELEARYSTEDSMAFVESILNDEPSEESLRDLERIRDILEELPPREADFVDLYFFRRKKQTEIAQIFRCSQPTVCYRLQRATMRIQFILSLPDVTMEELEKAMTGFLSDPLDVQIMLLMYQTTCQSEAAKQLHVSQGMVRHRFMKATKRMMENERMTLFAQIFDKISKNLNILREVQRLAGESKVAYIID